MGLRDTVSDEVGIRIRTLGLATRTCGRNGAALSWWNGQLIQYLSQMSAMTQVDVGQMAQAIRGLMLNPDLRARMGKGRTEAG